MAGELTAVTVGEAVGLLRRVDAAGACRVEAAVAAAAARGEGSAAGVSRHDGCVVVEVGVGLFGHGGRLIPREKWGGKFPAALWPDSPP